MEKDGVKVFGELRGRVTQACVVTLEPVESEIFEEIDQIFVPEGSALARMPANDEGEMIVDPDGPDLPKRSSAMRSMSVNWWRKLAAWGSIPIRASRTPHFRPYRIHRRRRQETLTLRRVKSMKLDR